MSIFLGALAFFIVVWFLFFRVKRDNTKSNKVVHGKYHCVTVHFSKGACKAVQKLKDQRILSSEAPVLPLAECDSNNCSCRFQHHEERRVEERREAYHKALDDIVEGTMVMMPRSKTDRRKK